MAKTAAQHRQSRAQGNDTFRACMGIEDAVALLGDNPMRVEIIASAMSNSGWTDAELTRLEHLIGRIPNKRAWGE